MKQLQTIGLCGMFAVAALSCSKSSNNNNSSVAPGAVDFSLGSQAVKMQGTLSAGNSFIITAVGVLPGSKDTSLFNITIPNLVSASATSLQGSYSDTASNYDNTAS